MVKTVADQFSEMLAVPGVKSPAITLQMAKGFTLYMVRTPMSGRGDELIDRARTNLCR
jgi:hypothetical protein